MSNKSNFIFAAGAAALLAAAYAMVSFGTKSEYLLIAACAVLQMVILATGWNILGGFAGYVNFGAAGYFAVGAYTGVALYKAFELPLPLLIAAASCMGALLGAATGALTLRLRGVYFSIATLAAAIILETVVTNWSYVGGARGITVLRPTPPGIVETYQQWLFLTMVALAIIAAGLARYVQNSWIGRGLRALRDEEAAAESSGVPTLKLKLFATALSGAVMSAAGAPFALLMSFIEPISAFSLNYALSAIAMPLIGGTAHWAGPVLGALLIGSAQQAITVTFSGAVNVLVTGLLLMVFVIVAPQGLLGLLKKLRSPKSKGENK